MSMFIKLLGTNIFYFLKCFIYACLARTKHLVRQKSWSFKCAFFARNLILQMIIGSLRLKHKKLTKLFLRRKLSKNLIAK